MTLSVILLIVFTRATSATTPLHDFHYIYSCFESGEVQVDALVDGDVAAYADFSKDEMVIAVPHVPQSAEQITKMAYEFAKASIVHCHSILGRAQKADPGAILREDAPDISIYTRYEEEDGVLNTLFCLANHFYPPTINFTWTKNGVEITEGVLDLRYLHNSDGTFHRLSTLIFTPQEGDVYSCLVEHQTLHQPLSKSWELEKRQSSLSPAALFFIASLVLCLIGIATGIFFFNKERK